MYGVYVRDVNMEIPHTIVDVMHLEFKLTSSHFDIFVQEVKPRRLPR